MWETIVAAGLTLLLFGIFWLVYNKATGRREYKRFLREMEYESNHLVPMSAEKTVNQRKGKFISGVIYFNGRTKAFHFTNEKAFQRVVDEHDLRVLYSRLARPEHG